MGLEPLDVSDHARPAPPKRRAGASARPGAPAAAAAAAAVIACAWNLLAAIVFVRAGWADALFYRIYPFSPRWYPMPYRVTPVYLALAFALHVVVAAPVELGLAVRGCPPERRRWAVRRWGGVVAHQGVRFLVGTSGIVVAQSLSRRWWLVGCALIFLALFALTDRLGRIFGASGGRPRRRRPGVWWFGWAWTVVALGLASRGVAYDEVGSPLVVAKLAPRFSAWMLAGAVAATWWVGRRGKGRDAVAREFAEQGAWTPNLLARQLAVLVPSPLEGEG